MSDDFARRLEQLARLAALQFELEFAYRQAIAASFDVALIERRFDHAVGFGHVTRAPLDIDLEQRLELLTLPPSSHEILDRRAARRTRPRLRTLDRLLPLPPRDIAGAILFDRLQKFVAGFAHAKRGVALA